MTAEKISQYADNAIRQGISPSKQLDPHNKTCDRSISGRGKHRDETCGGKNSGRSTHQVTQAVPQSSSDYEKWCYFPTFKSGSQGNGRKQEFNGKSIKHNLASSRCRRQKR